MPASFSHPIAILPLRRWCPKYLNFSALVIGCLAPDFGYYIRNFSAAQFAHTLLGTISLCLPSGLLVLAIFYAVRPALCFILPQPHRAALTFLTLQRSRVTAGAILRAGISILLGAWSHTLWDAFTHKTGWFVQRIPQLGEPVLHVGNQELPVYYLLQQGSTILGAAGLAVAYFLWLRRRPIPPADLAAPETITDGQRYWLLLALALISLVGGAWPAVEMASHYEGYLAFRVLLFRTAVYASAVFVPVMIFASLVVYFMRERAKWSGTSAEEK